LAKPSFAGKGVEEEVREHTVIKVTGALAVAFLFFGMESGAERAEGGILNTLMVEERLSPSGELFTERRPEIWPSAVTSDISRTYGVPAHSEKTLVDKDTGHVLDSPRFPFRLRQEEELRAVLDRLVESAPSKVAWQQVSKSIVVQEGADDEENLLDTVISVELDGASVWEALEAIGREIIRTRAGERELHIYPPGNTHGHPPPAIFMEPGRVSLVIERQTAREAICRILESMHPVIANYHYAHSVRDTGPLAFINMYLFALDRETQSQLSSTARRRMTREELIAWHERARMKP